MGRTITCLQSRGRLVAGLGTGPRPASSKLGHVLCTQPLSSQKREPTETNLTPPFNKHSRVLSVHGTVRCSGLAVTHGRESKATATWRNTGREDSHDRLEPQLKSGSLEVLNNFPITTCSCDFATFAKLLNHSILCLTLLIYKMGRDNHSSSFWVVMRIK